MSTDEFQVSTHQQVGSTSTMSMMTPPGRFGMFLVACKIWSIRKRPKTAVPREHEGSIVHQNDTLLSGLDQILSGLDQRCAELTSHPGTGDGKGMVGVDPQLRT